MDGFGIKVPVSAQDLAGHQAQEVPGMALVDPPDLAVADHQQQVEE